MLQKQITELTKQNESLTKRCDKFRSSNESLKQMMKMQPGLVRVSLYYYIEGYLCG